MQNFELSLSIALAHSVVFFCKEDYAPVSDAKCCGGDPPAPTANETTAEMMQAMQRYLPGTSRVVNEQILPNELAQLNASQQVSPRIAALQSALYEVFGKQLNQTGQDISRSNAMASAGTDAAVLAGPGRDLIHQANMAQREIDPEYYRMREQSANAIGQMFQGQTGGETEAIQRFLNRQNSAGGNLNIPSMSNVISNAQTFGNASRDRLGQAIGAATGAMPGMRSGVDVFQQATGKPSGQNTGDARFMGAQTGMGQQSGQFAQGFMSQIGDSQRTAANINANRRDSLDRTMSTIGGISSAVGNVCCFIFLEACNGELPWTVRKYRDLYYTTEPTIAAGYMRMAKWLVPCMARWSFAKSLVNELMVKPMVQYGLYLEGISTNGIQYKGINNFWLKVWKLMGK